MKIEPKYYNCTQWEDWKNGMFRSVSKENDDNLLELSIRLLSDENELYKSMKRVITEWNISSEERLSKLDTNRRAWLGWAACSINHKSPDFITRKAWSLLTNEQRNIANLIAEKVIGEWETINYQEEQCIQLSFLA